jgi:N-glycosidase YbiA
VIEKISRFRGPYEFLSNFYPAVVRLNDVPYPTVEHAFQAAKTDVEIDRHWVGMATTPAEAKKRGRKVSLRPDWEDAKLGVMLDLLRQKFAIPHLGAQLAATLDVELVEDNWWGDNFWGTVRGEGENWLGVLLMHVRKEVQLSEAIPIVFLRSRERPW